VEDTLHSRHLSLTPSKQRRRIHVLIEQHLKYVRSESSPRRIQQKLRSDATRRQIS